MKRIAFIFGIMLVGVIALLESSVKQKKRSDYIPDTEPEYDEVWWDN